MPTEPEPPFVGLFRRKLKESIITKHLFLCGNPFCGVVAVNFISSGGLFDRRADFIRIATNAGTVFESIERWGSGAALHEVRYGVGQRKLLHGPGVGILRPYGKTL